jgi:hypothetical protein
MKKDKVNIGFKCGKREDTSEREKLMQKELTSRKERAEREKHFGKTEEGATRCCGRKLGDPMPRQTM